MSRIAHLLILPFAVLALAAVWGFQTPTSAAPTANTIPVTTTDDGLNEDGKCGLREALHNANGNSQFSALAGECPAGSASETDVVVLVSGAEYILNVAGAGQDEGDLDILANGLPLDIRLEVDEETSATIRANVGLNERVVEIHGATVAMDKVNLSGGSTADNGGGLLNNGGTLTLTNVSLQNNTANAGGGLYNANGSVTISNSQVIINQGALGGGGLANSGPDAHLTLQGTTVRVNESSGGSGGGVLNGEGVLVVEAESAINLNTAFMAGGGIHSSNGGHVTIQNSTVQGNTAKENHGGGIYLEGVEGVSSVLTITHSTITDNKATKANTGWGGGVMLFEGVTADISHSHITHNEAHAGGGLFAEKSELTVSDSHVLTNTAVMGGGIINREGRVVGTAVTVQGNITTEPGGGIYNTAGQLSLTHSAIQHNLSDAFGGGVVNTAGAITLTHTLVEYNQAATGGGIANLGGTLTLNASSVRGNLAQAMNGGGIANENGLVVIQNGSELQSNGAQLAGGAIYNISGGQITLHDATVTNNTSNDMGGGIYSEGNNGLITAENVQFAANTAPFGDGGALYTAEGSEANITTSHFYENGGVNGGAVYVHSSSGTVTLNRTAVYSNTASQHGGGVWAGNVVALNNSTVSGNTAVAGGGLMVAGTGSATLIHVTLANNSLFDVYKNGDASLTMQNSVIATPQVNSCVVIATPISSLGGNVADDATCTGLDAPSDQVEVNPLLAPLGDNGGDTLTHALLEGSPAVDAAVVGGCTAEPINGIDQRGLGRGTAACDSGAFELGGTRAVYLPLVMR